MCLFRITLISHGYTFVAKGTVARLRSGLLAEGQAYDRLEPLQGNMIPVYLGSIDLQFPYYEFKATIVHMLLMSWGCGGSLYAIDLCEIQPSPWGRRRDTP